MLKNPCMVWRKLKIRWEQEEWEQEERWDLPLLPSAVPGMQSASHLLHAQPGHHTRPSVSWVINVARVSRDIRKSLKIKTKNKNMLKGKKAPCVFMGLYRVLKQLDPVEWNTKDVKLHSLAEPLEQHKRQAFKKTRLHSPGPWAACQPHRVIMATMPRPRLVKKDQKRGAWVA